MFPPPYPASPDARTRFVESRRPPRLSMPDPWQHQGVTVEEERQPDGRVSAVATVFLTGRECPWRCAMCDLWQYTTPADTPAGAIPAQLRSARQTLRQTGRGAEPTVYKLYNASSFFDPRAVPVADYPAIAHALSGASRVIVESHPALAGPRVDDLVDAFVMCAAEGGHSPVALEVAMGLETVNPGALDQLNKRVTADDFRAAASAVLDRGLDLRVFLLIHPPFVASASQDEWLTRSVEFSLACGASAISLIASRSGNGTMEALQDAGAFQPPGLDDVERSMALGLGAARGADARVFVDLWNLERVRACERCRSARIARLHAMNLAQADMPRIACDACRSAPDAP